MSTLNPPAEKTAHPLSLEVLKVRLRLREPTRFRFQHGGVLHGLSCQLFGHDLPPDLFPLALESGHIAYAAGDAYDFVIGAAGKSRALLREVEPALKVLSRQVRRLGAATLEGNFDFVGAEVLPRPSRDEMVSKAEAWVRQGQVHLLFPAPLRLKLPPDLGKPGAGFANGQLFPVELFLDRLWRRRHQLATGEFPPHAAVPAPPKVKAEIEELFWLDLPVRGRREGKPGKPRGTTLGGVVGAVVLEGLPFEWLLLLAELAGAGVGSGTHFGFGACFVEELPAWWRPARTYEEMLGFKAKDPRAVAAALTPPVLAILDEGAAFFRLGLSRHSATEGLRRAREAGFGAPVAGAGTDFVAQLDEKKVMARAKALWPAEPLAERLRAANPEVAKLVGKLFAAELAEKMRQEGQRLVRIGGQLRVWAREAAARAA